MTSDSAASLLRGRKVLDLGVELFPGMPHVPTHSPFLYQMVREHGDMMYGDGVSAAVDIFGMSCHTGTHQDGLGHFAKHLCLHGGTPAAEGANAISISISARPFCWPISMLRSDSGPRFMISTT